MRGGDIGQLSKMAQRRMFSKTITNSGKFLKMPATSRLLYYDLGMNADDDGYTEWFTIVRMSGSTEQDLQVLQANGFVKIFDDNVLVILDWKENNFIRSDRYVASKYLGKYKNNEMSEIGIPDDNQRSTQVRLGKVRLEEVSIEQKTESKDSYGEFNKVKLKKEEYEKLVERMGEANTLLLIAELDTYIASKGKKYSSHYATILGWARRRVMEIKNNNSSSFKGRGLA